MESPAANRQAVCPQCHSVRKPLPARAPPLRPQPVPPAGKTALDCVFVCVWLPARGPATWARASNVPRLQAEGLELHAGGATCASPACGSSSCAPRRGAGGRHGKGRGGGSRVPVPVPDPVRAPRSAPAPAAAGEAWPRLPVSARLAPRLWQQARCFCEHPAEASGGSAGVPGPRACERKFRARALCAFEVPASPRNVSQSGCTSGRPPPRAPSADSISASSNPPWCPFGVRFFLW